MVLYQQVVSDVPEVKYPSANDTISLSQLGVNFFDCIKIQSNAFLPCKHSILIYKKFFSFLSFMIGFKILSEFSCLSPPVKSFNCPRKGKAYFVDHYCYLCFMSFCLRLSVPCSLVVICWERADLLHVLFSCLFCQFSI